MKKKVQIIWCDFIKISVIVVLFFIVFCYVLGGFGYIVFSDWFNLVVIGVGGKGISDICYVFVGGCENVVVLCDVDFYGFVVCSVEVFFIVKCYVDF